MTLGVPRFQELLNATKNPKMTNCKIFFNKGTESIQQLREVINHNLVFYPNVTIQDSGGSIVEGEISYTNLNSLTVSFQASFSGTAYLS